MRPDLMRRAASSRPRRWGMDTIRGLDTLRLRGCKRSYGDAVRSCQPYDQPDEKRDRGARSPCASSVRSVASGRRRDRDPGRDRPCCPCRWFQVLAGRARSPKRRVGRACCPFPASHDPGHNRMRRDGRAASPGPAYAVRVRGPGSSFARSRARSCRSAVPPPRRRSRVCSPWRVAPSVHIVPPRISAAAPSSLSSGQRPGRLDVPSAKPETRPRPGSKSGFRRGLLRDDMDCAESWLERAGRGASTRGPRATTQTTCTRSAPMRLKARLYLTVAAIGIASLLAAAPAQLRAQTAVAIDNDDIGGVVTGANGPEAGVWVIAETTDLPTRYAKIVVTDDQGRYVLPDLPKAKYKVWVRGYGLADSPKVDSEPGQQLNLRATPAPNEAAAAQYYPAIYWYSMLKIPDK